MMSKLANCPFCGSEASDYRNFTNCSNDKCPLSVVHYSFDIWNTRPIEDKLQARLDALDTKAWDKLKAVGDYKNSHLCAAAEIEGLGEELEELQAENDRWKEANCDQSRELKKFTERHIDQADEIHWQDKLLSFYRSEFPNAHEPERKNDE